MICVYPADCKDFSNNGLGIVLPQSCTVTETLNGEWELTLIHPIDVDGKWTRLTEGCILRAPVPAAMTPQVSLVTQQYQTTVYDILIYKVSTQRDPLRLRSGPGTDYRILGKYAKETEIIVLDKSNSGWYEVTCPDGKHGYMSSEYLTYVRTDTGLNQSNVGFHNQTIQSRQLRDQPFRIYRVVPELDKVTVYARHVFYDLLDNMIKSLKPSPDAVGASVVQSLSASCLSAHGFTFYSDLTSSAEDVEWDNKNPVEAMLGEGSLVEKYGAELARDWFDVFLVQRVGHDSDVQIRERKNLTGISYDVDETMWSRASCLPDRTRTATSCTFRSSISTARISALMCIRSGFTCQCPKPERSRMAMNPEAERNASRSCGKQHRLSTTRAATCLPSPSRWIS